LLFLVSLLRICSWADRTPVGQVLVESPVTKEMVYEPVCISMVGAPGMNTMYIDA
jgi:hypothetical protein